MGLREIEANLPPGFRFYPSDEELICHYLYKKITREKLSRGTMEEVDLHTCEPWQLPDSAKLGANEWYFFSFRDRKYSTGSRTNRATTYGYWKATGRDRPVFDSSARVIVGMRKTLVYYLERAPNGVRTNWIMHEFRVEDSSTPSKEDWVLCRVFHKRKAEYTTLPQDHEYEGIVASSSPNIDIPAGLNQVNTICNISHEEDNPIDIESSHIPKHPHSNPSIAVNGDEFGFLLDMNLEDHNMKGELLSLDEMGF